MSDGFRRGLDDLTREVAERQAGRTGLPVPTIERAARSRRRRHDSLLAVGSAAVLVLVAVTGSALLNRPGPAPAPPAQTSTATPTPTPTQSTPTPTAEPVRTLAAKGDPAEPDAWVATDEVWATVGPGWALALFSTVAVIDTEDQSYGHLDPAGTQALFLVAPDGTTYRLTSVPADGVDQITWWDPTQRTAWLYSQGLGESWYEAQVDLRDGSVTYDFLGPNSRDALPVQQQSDGRVLWVDADPVFPTSVEGLYWQHDGSSTQFAGAEIQGDVWLDPDGDRVVYLSEAGTGLALTTIDLADGSVVSVPTAAAPEGGGCSILDVLNASVLATCTSSDPPFGLRYYEVTSEGTWNEVAERRPAQTRLIQAMLQCGAAELPWSPAGRVLPADLQAQGWSDAAVLPDAPGAGVPVPKKGSHCAE